MTRPPPIKPGRSLAWTRLQTSRLPQYGRRIWPRQELAQHAFRRAGAATRRVRPAWPCSFSAGRKNVLQRGRSYVWLRHPRVVSLADRSLGIGLTKACVRRSALLITTDSGPRHFAAAFNTPVITLFGPTHVGLDANVSSRRLARASIRFPAARASSRFALKVIIAVCANSRPKSVYRVALRASRG